MKKKKILRIIARLNVGGPAIHTVLLTDRIQSDEFESKLFAGPVPDNEGDMSYLAKDRGVEVNYIKELQRELSLVNDLKALFHILKIMLKYKPDIVHTHTAKAGFIGRGAAVLYNFISSAKVKTVHTFHGHVFHGYFSPAKTKLFLFIERTLARHTDKIVTITDKQQEEILNYGIGKKVQHSMIPLGLDLEKFYVNNNSNFLHESFSIPKNKKLIGIVARFTQIKNLEMFIRVASLIHKKESNTHFFMVGDGEDRPQLESFCKEQGASDFITFTGFLKNLPDIYSSLDLVLLTSNNEGSPVSIIEALSSGVPVVSTAVGGVPDLFTEFGKNYLVQTNDDEAMASASLDILSSQENNLRFVTEHQEDTYKKYRFDRLVQDLTETYKELTYESINIIA